VKIVVYDIEIAIPIEELKHGWEDAKKGKAGLASVVCYDSTSRRYHLYDKYTFDVCFDHLASADLLVGFNNIEFDTPALEGTLGKKLLVPQYDIIQAIRKANGTPFVKGYKLGQITERTLGLAKSGSGESAPHLYREGRIGELLDYNLNDVFLTKELYNHIVEHNSIIGVGGEPLFLEGHPAETI
jgi:DEAD/DEAH box helicase domain-containing protein